MSEINSAENHHTFFSKIVCLLLALILWIYVMEVENPNWEVTVEDVPLTFTGTDEIEMENDLTVYSYSVKSINVVVRGRRRDVENITANDITVRTDVSSITEAGEYELGIVVTTPDDTELIERSQTTVKVSVDKRERKNIPVTPKFGSLILEDQYKHERTVVSMQEITVTGPSRFLASIDHAEAVIPDLGRVTGSVTATCPLQLVDVDGGIVSSQFLTMSNTEATVQVQISMTKSVPVRITYERGLFNDDNVSVKASPETVTIKGDASAVRGIQEVVVRIDEKDIFGDETITTSFSLPEGVECPDGNLISVTVEHIGTDTRLLYVPLTNLIVTNPNNVVYELSQTIMMVTVRGSIDELNRITGADVVPLIDLSAYDGTMSLSVVASLPVEFGFSKTLTVYELGEYMLDMKIVGIE